MSVSRGDVRVLGPEFIYYMYLLTVSVARDIKYRGREYVHRISLRRAVLTDIPKHSRGDKTMDHICQAKLRALCSATEEECWSVK